MCEKKLKKAGSTLSYYLTEHFGKMRKGSPKFLKQGGRD